MDEFFNKHKKLIKILAVCLAAIVVLLCTCFVVDSFAPHNAKCYDVWVFSAISGSGNPKNSPNTYFQVDTLQDDNGSKVITYAKIDFSSSTEARTVKQIWVNLSDVYEDALLIDIKNTSSSTYIENQISNMTSFKTATITSTEIEESKDGWYLIADFTDEELSSKTVYRYFAFGFYSKCRVREIVCVDEDNKVVTYTIKGYSLSEKPYNTVEDGDPINNINDEQDKGNWEVPEEEEE